MAFGVLTVLYNIRCRCDVRCPDGAFCNIRCRCLRLSCPFNTGITCIGGSVGRRKALAGKEAGASVSLSLTSAGGGSSSSSVAVSEREAMSLLKRFLFPSSRWYDRVGRLSGGERRRLQLLQVLARAPNFLLLDEPSNDLDIATLGALEDFLSEGGGESGGGGEGFKGCLVVVSHDKVFMDKVADHLFVFEGDGVVKDFQGSYTDYLAFRKDQQQPQPQQAVVIAQPSRQTFAATAGNKSSPESEDVDLNSFRVETDRSQQSDSDPRHDFSSSGNGIDCSGSSVGPAPLSFAERKELNRLEQQVGKLAAQVAQQEAALAEAGAAGAAGAAGFSALQDMTQKLLELKEQLRCREEKWLELAERA